MDLYRERLYAAPWLFISSALVIKALLTPAMREEQPDNAFDGYTDVADLATELVRILDADAASINAQRIDLTS